nr:RNA-binding cell elongation regulator Jag/EloR [uncultured Anaerostipes sp.]
MSSRRFTGKTESDAVMNAAMELGIPSTDLDYEVIDPGSNGFFGLFKKPAIIEVKEKKEEKIVSKPVIEPQEKQVSKAKPKKKEEKKKERRSEKKNNSGKRTVNKQKEVSVQKEKKKNKAPENIDQITKSTEKYLDEVLRAMGLDPKLNLYYNRRDNVLNINVSGEKMGALIGKHGQTLDALQYLTSLFVNKKSESYIKIKLDTENYRERRQQTLEKLAGSIAYKVKKNKKPIYLEPMNPNERRIIHSALQRDPDVITKSEGKDPYRKVVVMLKK